MTKSQIEANSEVKSVVEVLKRLEVEGLEQVCIGSGWIRGWLTDTPRSDIDIAYIGKVPFEEAQLALRDTVSELGLEQLDWDYEGIWNSSTAPGNIQTTAQHFMVNYVSTVDMVYLASDGKLHDPTGHGLEDVASGTLRMTDHEIIDFDYKPVNKFYHCLVACRRIADYGWLPTPRSVELIKRGPVHWKQLSGKEKRYFCVKKVIKKFPKGQWSSLKKLYDEYGMGFIFDEAKAHLV